MIYNTLMLEKGLRAAFEEAYKGTLAREYLMQILSIMTMVPSNASSENYAWLGDFPKVREWIGDRKAGMLKDYGYAIKNKNWIEAISVHENELADDQMGAILPRAQMLGQVLAEFPMELVADFLINGTSNLAYDGVAFFSNASGDRTNDNLLAGTGITLAQVKADIATARAAMMKFTSDTGRVLGLKMDTIVCAPELESTMLEAVTAAGVVVAGQGTTVNPVSRWIKQVIVLPELTDATDWYGLATNYPIRPFVFQERQAVRTQLDDTEVKKNQRLVFQADMRGNAGYGLPHMAVKVVNS